MKKTNQENTIDRLIGIRLKNEAQSRGYKNRDMAELLHLSEKYISKIYGGTARLSDYSVDVICKEWHLRENYVRCIDEWKTTAEMVDSIGIQDKNALTATINYLKTLGYKIDLVYSTQLEPPEIYNNWDLLQTILTEECKNELLEKYDFSLSFHEFLTSYDFLLYDLDIVGDGIDEKKNYAKCKEEITIYLKGPLIGETHEGERIRRIDVGKKNITLNVEDTDTTESKSRSHIWLIPNNWVMCKEAEVNHCDKQYVAIFNYGGINEYIQVRITSINNQTRLLNLEDFQDFLEKVDAGVLFLFNNFIFDTSISHKE